MRSFVSKAFLKIKLNLNSLLIKFVLYFGVLLHGKMTNDDGSVSIPIIKTTEFEVNSIIQGYPVYHSIWQPKTGEQLKVVTEPNNIADK